MPHVDRDPLAYFITFVTYGAWLHGDERGSVDRHQNIPGTPRLPADAGRNKQARARMTSPPFQMDAAQRDAVLAAILDVCRYRGWWAHTVHVRSQHTHAVVSGQATPEKIMNDFKAFASRALNRLTTAEGEAERRDRNKQVAPTQNVARPAVRPVADARGSDELARAATRVAVAEPPASAGVHAGLNRDRQGAAGPGTVPVADAPGSDRIRYWARHGSTQYLLWSEEAVLEKIRYVRDGQGERMSYGESRPAPNDQDHSRQGRAV